MLVRWGGGIWYVCLIVVPGFCSSTLFLPARMQIQKTRPNRTWTPYIRPAPPYIVDVRESGSIFGLPLSEGLRPALAAQSVPEQSLDVIVHQVCAYVNEQDQVPGLSCGCKLVYGSPLHCADPRHATAQWTPEARRVLTGSQSGEFTLWNGLTFNFETILQAHDSAIRAFSYNHSGSYLISSDDHGIVKYFQPNMNNVAAFSAHREAVRGLSWSPDDARFVTASDDSKLKLWSFEGMREERTLTGAEAIHVRNVTVSLMCLVLQAMAGTSNALNGIQQRACSPLEARISLSSSGTLELGRLYQLCTTTYCLSVSMNILKRLGPIVIAIKTRSKPSHGTTMGIYWLQRRVTKLSVSLISAR